MSEESCDQSGDVLFISYLSLLEHNLIIHEHKVMMVKVTHHQHKSSEDTMTVLS